MILQYSNYQLCMLNLIHMAPIDALEYGCDYASAEWAGLYSPFDLSYGYFRLTFTRAMHREVNQQLSGIDGESVWASLGHNLGLLLVI